MKIYFVCRYDGPQWWYCMGLLSNGFHFADHVCSRPDFAPMDLYFRRQERVNALEKLFGIRHDTVETELIEVRSIADKPEWWERLANTQSVQDDLKPFYEAYNILLGKDKVPQPSIKVEVTE